MDLLPKRVLLQYRIYYDPAVYIDAFEGITSFP